MQDQDQEEFEYFGLLQEFYPNPQLTNFFRQRLLQKQKTLINVDLQVRLEGINVIFSDWIKNYERINGLINTPLPSSKELVNKKLQKLDAEDRARLFKITNNPYRQAQFEAIERNTLDRIGQTTNLKDQIQILLDREKQVQRLLEIATLPILTDNEMPRNLILFVISLYVPKTSVTVEDLYNLYLGYPSIFDNVDPVLVNEIYQTRDLLARQSKIPVSGQSATHKLLNSYIDLTTTIATVRQYDSKFQCIERGPNKCSALCISSPLKRCCRNVLNLQQGYCDIHLQLCMKISSLARMIKHYSEDNINIQMLSRPFSMANNVAFVTIRETIYIAASTRGPSNPLGNVAARFLNNPLDVLFTPTIKSLMYRLISSGARLIDLFNLLEVFYSQSYYTKFLLLAKAMADLNIRFLQLGLCYPHTHGSYNITDAGHIAIMNNIKLFAEQLAEHLGINVNILKNIDLAWWIKTITVLDSEIFNDADITNFISTLSSNLIPQQYFGNEIFNLYEAIVAGVQNKSC